MLSTDLFGSSDLFVWLSALDLGEIPGRERDVVEADRCSALALSARGGGSKNARAWWDSGDVGADSRDEASVETWRERLDVEL